MPPANFRLSIEGIGVIAETDDFVIIEHQGAFLILAVHEEDKSEAEYVLPHAVPIPIPRSDWVEMMIAVAFNAQDDDALKVPLGRLPEPLRNPRLWLVKQDGRMSKAHTTNRARVEAALAGKFAPEGAAFSGIVIEGNRIQDNGKEVQASTMDGKAPARLSAEALLLCAMHTLADPRMAQDAPEQFVPFVLAGLRPAEKPVLLPATPAVTVAAANRPALEVPIKPALATSLRATVIAPPGASVVAASAPSATPPAPQRIEPSAPPVRPVLLPTRVAAPPPPAPAPVPPQGDQPHRKWVEPALQRFGEIVREVVTSSAT